MFSRCIYYLPELRFLHELICGFRSVWTVVFAEEQSKVKYFLYWAIKPSEFQEAIQNINLHTFTNKRINVIFITFSVRMTWFKFLHVQAEVTLMAVQFINVGSFFLLRNFIGPKNPLSTARIAHFVFLRRSAKNMAAKFNGCAKSMKSLSQSWFTLYWWGPK